MITVDQHRVWADAHMRLGLTLGHSDFARAGLLGLLDAPRLLVRILPADPLNVDLDFTQELVTAVLPQSFGSALRGSVSFLNRHMRTAQAACNLDSIAEKGRAYVAVHRDGGVEAGAGSILSYRRGPEGPTVYRLSVIVHLIRQALEAQARLIDCVAEESQGGAVSGPFEILVAFPQTEGVLLGAYAEGWEPADHLFDDEVPRCLTPNVLIQVDLDQWPNDDQHLDALLIRIAGRVSDAFNDARRRFLVAGGPNRGVLQRSYA